MLQTVSQRILPARRWQGEGVPLSHADAGANVDQAYDSAGRDCADADLDVDVEANVGADVDAGLPADAALQPETDDSMQDSAAAELTFSEMAPPTCGDGLCQHPEDALTCAPDCAGSGEVGLTTCSSVTYKSPSGAQYDITFVLHQPYTCGQYANDDWFVIGDGSGVVRIDEITPGVRRDEANPSRLRNGWDVNPITSNTDQVYDGRMSGAHNPQYILPMDFASGTAVVKVASDHPDGDCTYYKLALGADLVALKSA